MNPFNHNEANSLTHVAKLDNGDLCYYDAATERPDTFTNNVFVYIGHGVIHSKYGIGQRSSSTAHFWRHRDRTTMRPARGA
jgi:hypothetical protein